ncbi:hypothetical protein HMPREF2974_07310 [Corynebacterium sp. HMSC078C09]|nr:hypothetical protein HMPREF2974_07310 [Corynebacterium sp. HMSC078C09]
MLQFSGSLLNALCIFELWTYPTCKNPGIHRIGERMNRRSLRLVSNSCATNDGWLDNCFAVRTAITFKFTVSGAKPVSRASQLRYGFQDLPLDFPLRFHTQFVAVLH